MGPTTIVVIVIGVIVLFIGAGMYNGPGSPAEPVRNAWAQIDRPAQTPARLDPQLGRDSQGLCRAREGDARERHQGPQPSRAGRGGGVGEQARAEQALSGALGRLMVVVEQYPDLKANQNFLGLQEELTSTENKIGFSRQAYNDQVMQYNTKIQSVPSNIVAGMFNFGEEEFFELEDEAAREVPKVSFS